MISDPNALAEIRSSWASALNARGIVQTNISFSFARGGITMPAFRELCYTLCAIYAYSVLHDALLQLRDEGAFTCKRSELGALMAASNASLPWVDFVLVDTGRDARNDAAHERVSMPIPDALKYIDAIGTELAAWKII